MRLNPYPLHYRTAFAFSGIPYPHYPQLSLRSACPFGREYGLIVFRVIDTGRVGVGYFPESVLSPPDHNSTSGPPTSPIWLKPFSNLWLVQRNEIYHRFT